MKHLSGESVNEYIHALACDEEYGGIQHLIFNTNDNTTKKLKPPEFEGLEEVSGSECIYVKSKDILLSIGGYRDFWTTCEPFGIWRYCLRKKKWTEMKKLSFNLEHVKCQLSANEKFIIIASGQELNTEVGNEKIVVLDISDDNDYKLRECTLKIPKIAWQEMALMCGE